MPNTSCVGRPSKSFARAVVAAVALLLFSGATSAGDPARPTPDELAKTEATPEGAAALLLSRAYSIDRIRWMCERMMPESKDAVFAAERTWLASHQVLLVRAEAIWFRDSLASWRDERKRADLAVSDRFEAESIANPERGAALCTIAPESLVSPDMQLTGSAIAKTLLATQAPHCDADAKPRLMSAAHREDMLAAIVGLRASTADKPGPDEYRPAVHVKLSIDHDGLPSDASIAKSSGVRKVDRAVIDWARRLRFATDACDSAQPREAILPVDLGKI